jgi:hypothetical protein
VYGLQKKDKARTDHHLESHNSWVSDQQEWTFRSQLSHAGAYSRGKCTFLLQDLTPHIGQQTNIGIEPPTAETDSGTDLYIALTVSCWTISVARGSAVTGGDTAALDYFHLCCSKQCFYR